jgi:mono/diheme cytochrome c family protein
VFDLSTVLFGLQTSLFLGYSIAALATIGVGVFLIIQLQRARGGSDHAANRVKFDDDETLETKRLDRVLMTALVFLIVSAIGLPMYWAREPGRQSGEVERFSKEEIKRGFQIFQATSTPQEPGGQLPYGCAGCHGSVGQGGAASWTVTDVAGRTKAVSWTAPAVNVAFQRYRPAEVQKILIYGRAGKPMPAWGAAGGGPMSEQQISDVMAYLNTVPKYEKNAEGICTAQYRTGIKLSEKLFVNPEDGSIPAENFDEDCKFKSTDEQTATIAEETSTPITQAQYPALKAYRDKLAELKGAKKADGTTVDPSTVAGSGAILFQTNCARCHTKGYSYGDPGTMGAGWFGPNLTGGRSLTQFPDKSTQIDFITEGVEEGKAYGTGGISKGVMPHFGNTMTEGQIDDVVAYARGL